MDDISDGGKIDAQLAIIPKLGPVWTYWEIGWWPAFGRLVPTGNGMYLEVLFQLGNTCPPFGGVASERRCHGRTWAVGCVREAREISEGAGRIAVCTGIDKVSNRDLKKWLAGSKCAS